MVDRILDNTIGALNTSLNLRQLNQNVISSNVANADTPGYKAQSVDFEQQFREILGTDGNLAAQATDPRHLSPKETDPVRPIISDDSNGVESLDGNTVDRSAEMAKMAENQLIYNASVEMLRKKLGMLRYTISEGSGGN